MHVNVMSSHNKETTNKYENQIILKYNAGKIAFFEKYKEWDNFHIHPNSKNWSYDSCSLSPESPTEGETHEPSELFKSCLPASSRCLPTDQCSAPWQLHG